MTRLFHRPPRPLDRPSVPFDLPHIVALIPLALLGWMLVRYAALWFRARAAQVPISWWALLWMRFRQIDPSLIVAQRILAKRAGLDLATRDLEATVMAGVRLPVVVEAMIQATRLGVAMPFQMATAIDLAGHDPRIVVQSAAQSVTLELLVPRAARNEVHLRCADGALVGVSGTLTVRTNMARYVGGGTVERLLALITAGLEEMVTMLPDHRAAIAQPELLAQRLRARHLERSTGFDVDGMLIRIRLIAAPPPESSSSPQPPGRGPRVVELGED